MVLIRGLFVLFSIQPITLLAQGSLPGTQALDWPEGDLSPRLMDGAHLFAERMISEAHGKRARHWNHDFSSREAYERSVALNRRDLRERIGAVDTR